VLESAQKLDAKSRERIAIENPADELATKLAVKIIHTYYGGQQVLRARQIASQSQQMTCHKQVTSSILLGGSTSIDDDGAIKPAVFTILA